MSSPATEGPLLIDNPSSPAAATLVSESSVCPSPYPWGLLVSSLPDSLEDKFDESRDINAGGIGSQIGVAGACKVYSAMSLSVTSFLVGQCGLGFQ